MSTKIAFHEYRDTVKGKLRFRLCAKAVQGRATIFVGYQTFSTHYQHKEQNREKHQVTENEREREREREREF